MDKISVYLYRSVASLYIVSSLVVPHGTTSEEVY